MLFVLVHAVRLFVAGRFTGPRWLAWITGLTALFLLWLVGFLGYWLVWDQRAQEVAVASARMLDVLPIFSDPMERAFFVDETVNSLLFFIVFFTHMLLPLGMGIALWLHIGRLNKARFLTSKRMTIWIVTSLTLVSAVAPATVAGPAQMMVAPERVGMDYWYLLPLVLMERVSGGTSWLLLLGAGVALMTVPKWMARRKVHAATVRIDKCNSCGQCEIDCPFNAISMVPRSDEKPFAYQSAVDPALCVGCGICAGSCDTRGIGLHESFSVEVQREQLMQMVRRSPGEVVHVVCANSGAKPTGLVMSVPCSGWVHPSIVELAVREGASAVETHACDPADCRFRYGPTLLRERLDGQRKPALRTDRVDRNAVSIVGAGASRQGALGRGIVAAVTLGVISVVTWLGSDLGYTPPRIAGSELVVSFSHPGQIRLGRELTEVEKARYPKVLNRTHVHLRERTPVRLRILVDGELRHDGSYNGKGLWGDLNAIAISRVSVTPGEHSVSVLIGDSPQEDEFEFQHEARFRCEEGRRCVVLFDRVEGFRAWPNSKSR